MTARLREASAVQRPRRPGLAGPASRAATLLIADLGCISYREASELQQRLHSRRVAGLTGDTLLLLEHPPVFTRGRRTSRRDLPFPEAWYRGRGVEVADADRGGSVTYHGPGQLVGYPIVGVAAVRQFVEKIEAAVIAGLAELGVAAVTPSGLTGVWVGDRKIASIGLRVANGVTRHGFAVNVDNDLEPFGWIYPCGMPGARMTSVVEETGLAGQLSALRNSIARQLAKMLELRPSFVDGRRSKEPMA